MAYRSPPQAGPSCARHDAAPAVGQCTRCDALICTPCSMLVGLDVLCPRCNVPPLLSTFSRCGLGVIVLLLAGSAYISILADEQALRIRLDSFGYRAWYASAGEWRRRVDAHPCDVLALSQLVDAYLADHEGALGGVMVDRSLAVCADRGSFANDIVILQIKTKSIVESSEYARRRYQAQSLPWPEGL